jgi:hypothetical protein
MPGHQQQHRGATCQGSHRLTPSSSRVEGMPGPDHSHVQVAGDSEINGGNESWSMGDDLDEEAQFGRTTAEVLAEGPD